MADYESFKIPIFSGINDVSVYPSATSGGNISHFYDFYNQLIDAITSDINNIQEAISIIQTQLPPPPPVIEEFVFSNVTTSDVNGNQRATLGTVPKTGKLTRITIDDINDGYGASFIIDGTYLYYSDYQIIPEGHEWSYPDAELPEVVQGQEIIMETSAVETNRTVKIYIQTQIPSAEPTLEVYEFSGINTIDLGGGNYGGTVGTIPKTGKLQKIAIDNIGDGYGTFFSTTGGNTVLTFDAFETATEGYQWKISDDDSQDVTQGQELSFQTTAEELNRTFYLYIYG